MTECLDEVSPAEPLSPKSHSLVSEIAIVALTQGVVMVALFLNYGFIKRNWGLSDLGAYSLMMRMRGLLEWIVTLQLPIAIAREIAVRTNPRERSATGLVVWSGVGLGFGLLSLFALVIVAVPAIASGLIFGNSDMRTWIGPFAVLFVGYGACLLVSSVARGFMLFRINSALQISFAAVVPALLLIGGRHSPFRTVVTLIGLAAMAIAAAFLMRIRSVRRTETALETTAPSAFRAHAGRLVAYGGPRITTVLGAALFAGAMPWIVSRNNSPALLVAVNALFSLLSSIAAAINPLGIVLLPHLSKLLGDGREDQARHQVSQLVNFVLCTGPFLTLVSFSFLQPLIRAWLGPEVAKYSALIIAFGFSLAGMTILEMLRNPIDAASAAPWNALSYGAGAAALISTFAACLYVMHFDLETSAAIAVVVAYGAAAGVSLVVAARLYRVEFSKQLRLLLPMFALLSTVCMVIRLGYPTGAVNSIVGAISALMLAAATIHLRPAWISTLASRLPMWRAEV